MAKITDRQAQAIKPGSKALASGVAGLTLQPGKTAGTGKWILRFVSPATGKRRDMGLGSYPDTGVAEALATATTARQQIASDIDPIEARNNLTSTPTFETAARERWKEVALGFRNKKHIAQWISSLEQYVFPHIGLIRVDQLRPKSFADLLRPIWLTIPETASRVKQRCSDVMAWSWAHGYAEGNPLDVTGHLLPSQPTKKAHQPAMPWPKVEQFISNHLVRERMTGGGAALLFAILTASRSGEVRGATWKEVDFENRLWTVPAERMKANSLHRVPLSKAAVELLQKQKKYGLHDELVFPSPRGKVLSDMALTALLRRVDAPSDVPGRVATAHGFRSSFRNWAADSGYPADIAERALAHTIANKVQAAYERTDRLQARRDMMEQWAMEVIKEDAIVTLQKTG